MLAIVLVALPIVTTVHAAPASTPPAVSATFEETPDRVVPFGAPETVEMTVSYDCTRERPAEATAIDVQVLDRPDWLTARPDPSVAYRQADAETCADGEGRRTVAFEWSLVAGDAPARRPANLTVQATVTLADGNHTARATVPVEATFYSVVSVAGTPLGKAPASETAEIDLEIHNRGNGPVRFELVPARVDDGLDLDLPEPGRTPAAGQGGTPTWNASIAAEGAEPDAIYTATLEITTRYAEDPSAGVETRPLEIALQTESAVSAQIQGGQATLPSALLGLVAGSLVTLVWIARHPRT